MSVKVATITRTQNTRQSLWDNITALRNSFEIFLKRNPAEFRPVHMKREDIICCSCVQLCRAKGSESLPKMSLILAARKSLFGNTCLLSAIYKRTHMAHNRSEVPFWKKSTQYEDNVWCNCGEFHWRKYLEDYSNYVEALLMGWVALSIRIWIYTNNIFREKLAKLW